MKVANKTQVTLCPDCEMKIKFNHMPKMGEKVLCPHCDAFLVVVDLSPLELDWDMNDYEDDWDISRDDHWNEDDDW